MRRIDADLTTPLALEQAAEEAVRATLRREAAVDTSDLAGFCHRRATQRGQVDPV